MTNLVTTAKSASANSYASVSEAEALLVNSRLYADAWSGAAGPTAEEWTVDGGASTGETSVPVTGGSGTFTEGSSVFFAGHATVYKIAADFDPDNDTSITLSSALTADVVNGEAITRITWSDQESALAWATALLDQCLDWYGYKTTGDQALRWPRTGLIDRDGYIIDYDTIPNKIKWATAELALALLQRDRVKEPDVLGLGMSDIRLGPTQVVVDPAEMLSLIPRQVRTVLAEYGEPFGSSAGGTRMLPVVRT